MLPLVLVLFGATSALAAPSVLLNQYDYYAGDNSLSSLAFNTLDGGDTNVYILNAEQVLNELARGKQLRGATYGQIVALLGVLSAGRPGDACTAARLINSYVAGKSIGAELAAFRSEVASNIDLIVQRAVNPEAAKFSVSAGSGCSNEGRIYQLDAAWKSIIGSTSPGSYGLVEEQRCLAKRMYYAVDARTNIAGTTLTAASLPPVQEYFEGIGGALSGFLQALASGQNISRAAAAAKNAILS